MTSEPASAFDQLGVHLLIILLFPFFVTVAGTPIARELALRFRIVDKPIEHSSKVHTESTPYLGGLPLFIAILVGTIIVLHQTSSVLHDSVHAGLIIGAIVFLFLVGLWDDILGMIPGVKMFLLAVAGTMLFYGGCRVMFIPVEWGIAGEVLSWALTLFWILGISNAANLMDNMNGLAAGTGIVAGLSIFVIGVIGEDPAAIGLSMILVGALLGYIPYNYPKAKIFFGDAGSFTLGFYLSFLGLFAGRLPAPEGMSMVSHTLAPILVMGVFVFDTFFVAFSRGKRKINFWWGGQDHTSHRFVNYGFSKELAVVLVWLLGAVFGGVAILTKVCPSWLSTILAVVLLGSGIWFWRKLDRIPVERVKIGIVNSRRNRFISKHQKKD